MKAREVRAGDRVTTDGQQRLVQSVYGKGDRLLSSLGFGDEPALISAAPMPDEWLTFHYDTASSRHHVDEELHVKREGAEQ